MLSFDDLDTESEPQPVKFRELLSYGDGFTSAGHHRVDLATLTRAIQTGQAERAPPPAGISKRPAPSKKAKSWWAAQVRLYGLRCTGAWTVSDCKQVLTAALADGTLKVPDDLRQAEERADKEYVQKNRELEDERRRLTILRDEKYNAASTDEHKACIDPIRFLTERDGRVAVLRLSGFGSVYRTLDNAAKRLNFLMKSVQDVGHQDAIVVGKVEDDVNAEINRIRSEVEEEKAEKRRKIKEQKEERRQKAVARHQELIETGDGGDITGIWALDMPEYDKYLENVGDEIGENTMDVTSHRHSDLVIWAALNFAGRHGWLKIWLPNTEAGPALMNTEMKVGWQLEYDEMDDGEVTHEIPNGGLVTFTSAHECFGSLSGWFGGPYEFRGLKVSVQSTADVSDCEESFAWYQKLEDEWRADDIDMDDLEAEA